MQILTEVQLKRLGKRVARLRYSRGMTQLHLAEVSGLSERQIIRIENGHSTPSPASLAAIAAALESTPQHIITGRKS